MNSLIAELLTMVLTNEDNQEELFNFISTSISDINKKNDNYFDLYLIFIMKLTKFLGISPSNIYEDNKKKFFSLREARFIDQSSISNDIILKQDEIDILKYLWERCYDKSCKRSFNKAERSTMLRILMLYYQLHIEGFRIPKSIKVIDGYSK